MQATGRTIDRDPETWWALVIGNSRLHWAQFVGTEVHQTWDMPHLSVEQTQPLMDRSLESLHRALPLSSNSPIWIASVVASQTTLWQNYPLAHLISLEQVPLKGMYSTLGLDRALAVLGAIVTLSSPVLVIDAGTAMTFTGADGDGCLVGGAILPGLQLQFQALGQFTSALPIVQSSNAKALPPRWASTTRDAIASGVIHTLLAGLREFVEAWWQQFPTSSIVLTGGDCDRLHRYLSQQFPRLATKILVNPHLIFYGIQTVKSCR